jgi:hypothetical protein
MASRMIAASFELLAEEFQGGGTESEGMAPRERRGKTLRPGGASAPVQSWLRSNVVLLIDSNGNLWGSTKCIVMRYT